MSIVLWIPGTYRIQLSETRVSERNTIVGPVAAGDTLSAQEHLDGDYTVFGKLVEGDAVMPSLARGEPPSSPTRIVAGYAVEKITLAAGRRFGRELGTGTARASDTHAQVGAWIDERRFREAVESLVVLCDACSLGDPHDHHDHRGAWANERRFGLALCDDRALSRLRRLGTVWRSGIRDVTRVLRALLRTTAENHSRSDRGRHWCFVIPADVPLVSGFDSATSYAAFSGDQAGCGRYPLPDRGPCDTWCGYLRAHCSGDRMFLPRFVAPALIADPGPGSATAILRAKL